MNLSKTSALSADPTPKKESLAYFIDRRERWLNARRQRVRPIDSKYQRNQGEEEATAFSNDERKTQQLVKSPFLKKEYPYSVVDNVPAEDTKLQHQQKTDESTSSEEGYHSAREEEKSTTTEEGRIESEKEEDNSYGSDSFADSHFVSNRFNATFKVNDRRKKDGPCHTSAATPTTVSSSLVSDTRIICCGGSSNCAINCRFMTSFDTTLGLTTEKHFKPILPTTESSIDSGSIIDDCSASRLQQRDIHTTNEDVSSNANLNIGTEETELFHIDLQINTIADGLLQQQQLNDGGNSMSVTTTKPAHFGVMGMESYCVKQQLSPQKILESMTTVSAENKSNKQIILNIGSDLPSESQDHGPKGNPMFSSISPLKQINVIDTEPLELSETPLALLRTNQSTEGSSIAADTRPNHNCNFTTMMSPAPTGAGSSLSSFDICPRSSESCIDESSAYVKLDSAHIVAESSAKDISDETFLVLKLLKELEVTRDSLRKLEGRVQAQEEIIKSGLYAGRATCKGDPNTKSSKNESNTVQVTLNTLNDGEVFALPTEAQTIAIQGGISACELQLEEPFLRNFEATKRLQARDTVDNNVSTFSEFDNMETTGSPDEFLLQGSQLVSTPGKELCELKDADQADNDDHHGIWTLERQKEELDDLNLPLQEPQQVIPEYIKPHKAMFDEKKKVHEAIFVPEKFFLGESKELVVPCCPHEFSFLDKQPTALNTSSPIYASELEVVNDVDMKPVDVDTGSNILLQDSASNDTVSVSALYWNDCVSDSNIDHDGEVMYGANVGKNVHRPFELITQSSESELSTNSASVSFLNLQHLVHENGDDIPIIKSQTERMEASCDPNCFLSQGARPVLSTVDLTPSTSNKPNSSAPTISLFVKSWLEEACSKAKVIEEQLFPLDATRQILSQSVHALRMQQIELERISKRTCTEDNGKTAGVQSIGHPIKTAGSNNFCIVNSSSSTKYKSFTDQRNEDTQKKNIPNSCFYNLYRRRMGGSELDQFEALPTPSQGGSYLEEFLSRGQPSMLSAGTSTISFVNPPKESIAGLGFFSVNRRPDEAVITSKITRHAQRMWPGALTTASREERSISKFTSQCQLSVVSPDTPTFSVVDFAVDYFSTPGYFFLGSRPEESAVKSLMTTAFFHRLHAEMWQMELDRLETLTARDEISLNEFLSQVPSSVKSEDTRNFIGDNEKDSFSVLEYFSFDNRREESAVKGMTPVMLFRQMYSKRMWEMEFDRLEMLSTTSQEESNADEFLTLCPDSIVPGETASYSAVSEADSSSQLEYMSVKSHPDVADVRAKIIGLLLQRFNAKSMPHISLKPQKVMAVMSDQECNLDEFLSKSPQIMISADSPPLSVVNVTMKSFMSPLEYLSMNNKIEEAEIKMKFVELQLLAYDVMSDVLLQGLLAERVHRMELDDLPDTVVGTSDDVNFLVQQSFAVKFLLLPSLLCLYYGGLDLFAGVILFLWINTELNAC